MQQQQQQKTTFFTTLNQAAEVAGQHRNINEFINRCENSDDGINFLQDSEIQSRQIHLQEQQQHHLQIADNYQGQISNNTFGANYQGKIIQQKHLGFL